MANSIHKLAKKAPPFSFRLLRRASPSLISHQPSLTRFNLHDYLSNPSPFTLLIPTFDVNSLKQTQHVYPNFPFGFFLNPVSSSGFDRLGHVEDEDEGDSDIGIIRADSVKKKRKKKMNKHKYKKLRKRLRRKSRA